MGVGEGGDASPFSRVSFFSALSPSLSLPEMR